VTTPSPNKKTVSKPKAQSCIIARMGGGRRGGKKKRSKFGRKKKIRGTKNPPKLQKKAKLAQKTSKKQNNANGVHEKNRKQETG